MIQAQLQRSKYLETTVSTATPAQLLLMLFDGAIRNCRAGIEAIQQNRPADAHNAFSKAQDIISEFTITLDREAPIAADLLKLYEYFQFRLIEANTKKQAEPAEEVLQHLQELKETWYQASKLLAHAPVAAQAEAVHG
ncbi:flagellar protein FliS [Paenibacillus sp. J31TS4]|uniref:flagellar export chaperone FliS n=1 Tax=Paenibacillus sp. J31TS4 TaxID=2807195 RepID=UPI001B1B962F|nr:flagellar export chaperone FliS [Paenibacillus sp. J31TS4]GIP40992.1 flagellar protein FliS [Paenibacillus sp. J31TS4]